MVVVVVAVVMVAEEEEEEERERDHCGAVSPSSPVSFSSSEPFTVENVAVVVVVFFSSSEGLKCIRIPMTSTAQQPRRL